MTLNEASFAALIAMFLFIAFRVECLYRASIEYLQDEKSEAGNGPT